MIHYDLQCEHGHAFDGWFKDSASFDAQAERGFVTCPHCNSASVQRALMAPALGRNTRHATEPRPAPALPAQPLPEVPQGAVAGATLPDQMRTLLHKLRSEVEKNCDYVGEDFAEEARRIHYGETESRGIYGETTQAEAEALSDEGIEFGVLPWLPRSDS